jgi:uncharacterized membrane protein
VRHVTSTVDIAAPSAEVWALLTEFRLWPRWGPSIRSVQSDADRVATGVTGRVQTVLGVSLPFVITAAEPERHWHWRVAGVPATGHVLAERGPFESRVVFTVPWWFAPYVVVLRWSLHRLKRLAEDGR